MTSKISRISSVSTSRIESPTSTGRHAPGIGGATINERLNFPEIDLPEREVDTTIPEERLNYEALVGLFSDIINNGVSIIPTLPKDHGGFIAEASFKPPLSKNQRCSIQVPLRGVSQSLIAPSNLLSSKAIRKMVCAYTEPLLVSSTDADILRLIIVLSHEFGHYLSYARGFHDQDLRQGISIFASKACTPESAKYTWLVYREECNAWRYGKEVLTKYGFDYFDIFEKVKHESLVIYFKELKLAKASIDVYCKLSMLGDDFIKHNR
jgi:hypothetical protein